MSQNKSGVSHIIYRYEIFNVKVSIIGSRYITVTCHFSDYLYNLKIKNYFDESSLIELIKFYFLYLLIG